MDIIKAMESKSSAEREMLTDRLCEAIIGYHDPEYTGEWKENPDSFSIRRLWEQMVGPVSQTLDQSRGKTFLTVRVQEAVMAAAFPKITGALIASKVLEGYNEPKLVGDNLVTVLPSKRRNETLVGFTEPGGLKEVKEHMPYEETELGELYVTSNAKKYGRLIGLTAEAIMEDQTGQLLIRAKRLGKQARIHKEKIILGCVIDLTGWKWYYPLGTSTAIYSAANQVTAGLVDWTDIDAARQKLAGQVDNNGDPIFAPNAGILVSDALWATAHYIVNSTEVRAATAVHIVSAVTAKQLAPITGVYSSPFLDLATFGNSSTKWYYGSFKDAFIYQEIWPIQVLTRAGDSDAKWLRDIDTEYKVRLFGGAACVDNKYVIECDET